MPVVVLPSTARAGPLRPWVAMAIRSIGAALRGGAELIGGYSPGWSVLVGLGGTLAVVAFTTFAFGLWRATRRAPLA